MFEQKKITYKMKLLSSLAKVFQDEEPVYQMECQTLSALWGETVSFQAAYTGDFLCGETGCGSSITTERLYQSQNGGAGSGRKSDEWNCR